MLAAWRRIARGRHEPKGRAWAHAGGNDRFAFEAATRHIAVPMHEALCRSSGTTLDSVHAEDGPPITQRTSGLSDFRPHLYEPHFCDEPWVRQAFAEIKREEALKSGVSSSLN